MKKNEKKDMMKNKKQIRRKSREKEFNEEPLPQPKDYDEIEY